MNKNMLRKTVVLLIALLLVLLPSSVLADMGPKPKLTITLQNPPTEEYYLDLLTKDLGEYDNLENDETPYDETMLAALQSYSQDGWHAAYAGKTPAPLFGSLIGEMQGDSATHTFGYVGLPDEYKIIIVTKSGDTFVSEARTRSVLQSSVTLDYSTELISSKPAFVSYIAQFFSTFIPTLIIEGVLLLLFGFSLKENFKVFFLANLLTQIVLTLTLGITLIKSGTIAVSFAQFPVELLIMIFETAVYAMMLRGKTKGRRIFYGIAANATSWLIGALTLTIQFNFLMKLL